MKVVFPENYRPDLEIMIDGVETCFIELPRIKLSHVIGGCIYRHPHSDRKDFQENLREKLEYLNRQGYEVYITGDINQDFFQYSTDKLTVAAAFNFFVYFRLHAHFFPVIIAFFSFGSLSRN